MLQRMMTEDAKVDENVAKAYKYAFRNPGITGILHKLLTKYLWQDFLIILSFQNR